MASPFTHSQQVAFAILLKVSGTLGLFGSTYIIQDVLRDKVKQKRIYCRLLLGSSIFSWISSLMGGILSTWPIPEDDPFAPPFAAGNMATCTFQGFFLQLSTILVIIYSMGLTCYYFFILVHKWPDHRLKRLEHAVHGIALTIGVGTAVAGIPLQLYNNSGLYCWISSLPHYCEDGNLANGGFGECQRGYHAWNFRWAFFYGPLWFFMIANTIIMGRVSWLVWSTEKKSRKYRQPGATTATTTKSKTTRRRPDKLRSLALQVFWQSVHYVMAFYISWIFPCIFRFLQTMNKPVPADIIYAMCFLMPLQGFWYYTIYTRPQIQKLKQRCLAWIKQRLITRSSSNLTTELKQPDNSMNCDGDRKANQQSQQDQSNGGGEVEPQLAAEESQLASDATTPPQPPLTAGAIPAKVDDTDEEPLSSSEKKEALAEEEEGPSLPPIVDDDLHDDDEDNNTSILNFDPSFALINYHTQQFTSRSTYPSSRAAAALGHGGGQRQQQQQRRRRRWTAASSSSQHYEQDQDPSQLSQHQDDAKQQQQQQQQQQQLPPDQPKKSGGRLLQRVWATTGKLTTAASFTTHKATATTKETTTTPIPEEKSTDEGFWDEGEEGEEDINNKDDENSTVAKGPTKNEDDPEQPGAEQSEADAASYVDV